MDPAPILPPSNRAIKAQREEAILAEYEHLVKTTQTDKRDINDYLMKKYNIQCVSTLYNIRYRAQIRRQQPLEQPSR